MKRLILILISIASIASAQMAGSVFTLTKTEYASDSATGAVAIYNFVKNHDSSETEAWSQRSVVINANYKVLPLNRGTKIVVMSNDKGIVKFHFVNKTQVMYVEL